MNILFILLGFGFLCAGLACFCSVRQKARYYGLYHAEKELKAGTEMVLAAFNACPAAIAICTINGTYLEVNEKMCELVGVSRGEMIGRIPSELGIVNEQEHWAAIKRINIAGGALTFENTMHARTGEDLIVLISVNTIYLNNAPYYVVAYVDITEQKRFEKEAKQSRRRQVIGMMADIIDSEFTVLLEDISRCMNLMKQSLAESGERRARTFANLERVQVLARRLSSFSQGKSLARSAQALGPVLEQALQSDFNDSSTISTIQLPQDLWDCIIDPEQIAQVVGEIVLNARQAMPEKGRIIVSACNVPVSQAPSSLSYQDYVKISVQDQGQGILPEYIPHVFTPFFTTKPDANGLGLSVCSSIVHRHEGRIEVESIPGRGTVFHIYLPASHAIATSWENDLDERTLFKGKLLLVDDEEAYQDAMTAILTDVGFSVSVAADVEEALTFTRQARESGDSFKIAILDMADHERCAHISAIKELLDVDPSIKIIAANGSKDHAVLKDPGAFGFHGVIAKPYSIPKLGTVLADVLEGKTGHFTP